MIQHRTAYRLLNWDMGVHLYHCQVHVIVRCFQWQHWHRDNSQLSVLFFTVVRNYMSPWPSLLCWRIKHHHCMNITRSFQDSVTHDKHSTNKTNTSATIGCDCPGIWIPNSKVPMTMPIRDLLCVCQRSHINRTNSRQPWNIPLWGIFTDWILCINSLCMKNVRLLYIL